MGRTSYTLLGVRLSLCPHGIRRSCFRPPVVTQDLGPQVDVMYYRYTIYILIAALAYLVVLTIVGRLPCLFTDEIFFKAAGREWAATGRFAAPELAGALGLAPPLEEVWLPYPPLYPILFGGFVKVFGFGWRACVAFDALIHACLAVLTFGVALGLSTSRDRRVAFCLGFAGGSGHAWSLCGCSCQ